MLIIYANQRFVATTSIEFRWPGGRRDGARSQRRWRDCGVAPATARQGPPAVVVRSDLLRERSYATILATALRGGISVRIDLAPSPENGLRAASQVLVDWPELIRFTDMGQALGHLDMRPCGGLRSRWLSF